jgi:FlgD Ig-like domain/IPT/TIG domain
MRPPCLLALVLLAATPQVASAGLDLTWSACNTTASGTDNIVLDCSIPSGAQLFGNFQTDAVVPQFLAMDIVLDIRTGGGSLPPFWHFENGGCNSTALLLSDSKPTTQCPNATNATPWGPNGNEATSAITAILPGQGGPDRTRILITIARPSTQPITLAAGQNYFGFELDVATDGSSSCAGCTTPAVIGWSKAILYGSGNAVILGQSGSRLATVAVNGGIPGPTVFEVRPASSPGTPAIVDMFGRNLVPGTTAALARSGQPNVNGTGISTSPVGDLLHATFDVTGKPGGFWNVTTSGAGNTDVLVNGLRTTGSFKVDSMYPRLGDANTTVPVTIYGSELVAPVTVKLTRPGDTDILGVNPIVAADGKSLQTAFALTTSAGLSDVKVTNGDLTTLSVPGGFEVVIPLRITSVAPNVAGNTGPVQVIIAGMGIRSGATAALKHTGLPDIVGQTISVDPGGLSMLASFDLLNQPLGVWDVAVTNPGSLPSVAGNVFLITIVPSISSIDPSIGSITGSTTVVIHGQNFDPGAVPRLTRAGSGPIGAQNTTIAPDGMSINTTFNLVGRTPGFWNVEVTNPGDRTGVLPNGFLVQGGPTITGVSPTVAIDTSVVALTILGVDIPSGSTAKLTKSGLSDIVGTSVVVNPAGTSMTGLFDIRGKAGGPWNVVVTNPAGAASALPNVFTVTKIPTLTAINPTSATSQQVIGATVSGTNIVPGAVIRLERAASPTIVGTSVSVAPSGSSASVAFNLNGAVPGVYDVVVVNPGNLTARLTGAFEVLAAPRIDSVNPTVAADTSAALLLTLSGSQFLAGATVKLMHSGVTDIPGTSVTIAPGGTSMTATFDLRGRLRGLWNVVVINPNGVQFTMLNGFTITAIPVIAAISPNFGLNTQTVNVQITGTGLVPGASVRLERLPGTTVTGVVGSVDPLGSFINASFDLLPVPPQTYDVVVVNPGSFSGRLNNAFEVRAAPRIDSVTPDVAVDTSVVTLSAIGAFFQPGATAKLTRLGEPDIVGTGVSVGANGTSLTGAFDIRGRAGGAWNFVVTNPTGLSFTRPNAFTVSKVPTVTSIVPGSGVDTQVSINVAIHGSGFVPGLAVRLEGLTTINGAVTSVSLPGDLIQATFDLSLKPSGFYDVVVTNPGNSTSRLSGAFEVHGTLRVLSIVPAAAPDTGAALLTINGSNILPGATARLTRTGEADIVGTGASVNPGRTALTATFDLRGRAQGLWNVVVTNPDAIAAILANAFTISRPPIVTAIVPAAGSSLEFVTASVLGSNFGSTAEVRLRRAGNPDIVGVGTVVLPGGNEITTRFDLRGAGAGRRDVVVTSFPGNATATLPAAFKVGVGPLIQSIAPNNAESGAQVSTTITGTGFVAGAKVMLTRLGQPDIVVSNPVIGPTSITAQLDLLNVGIGDLNVVVVNPDSIPGFLVNGFHVLLGPRLLTVTPSKGENAGLQNIVVTGEGFFGGTLSLKRAGQSDIIPLAQSVSPDRTAMSGVLDLTSKAPGLWDVYVTSPSGSRAILFGGFEVTVAPPTFASGLDLTWSACNAGTSAGNDNLDFDCANPAFGATLFANYRLPRAMSQLVAMDAVIDIETATVPLQPFWHFELGGCNTDALSLSAGRPSTECPTASNGTAWGPAGSAAQAAITAYLPSQTNRAQMLITVARALNNPIAVPGGTNYYAFHLNLFMDGAGACAGCSDAAQLSWSTATFYSAASNEAPLVVTAPGLRSKLVRVNGGLPGLSVTSAAPAATPAVGYVPVSVYGRNIVPGATVNLLTPTGPLALTNVSVAPDGRTLTALADLRNVLGVCDVQVRNPGGELATRIGAINVGSAFPGPPRVTVITPNGGEVLVIGTSYSFRWQAYDDRLVTSVDLYISQRGISGPYETLALGIPNTGTVGWNVSSPFTDTGYQCFFKVVAHDDDGNTSEDISDSPWRITSVPTATLVARFEATPLDQGIEVAWQIAQVSRLGQVGLERGDNAMGPWTTIDAARAVTDATVIVKDLTTAPGQRYFYRLHGTYSGGREFSYGPIVAIAGGTVQPTGELALSVAPNPTSGPTTVAFTLASEAKVRVSVIDVMGRELAVLENGTLPAGRHEARWDGRARQGAAPTGIYFMRMEASGRTFMKRFVLAR